MKIFICFSFLEKTRFTQVENCCGLAPKIAEFLGCMNWCVEVERTRMIFVLVLAHSVISSDVDYFYEFTCMRVARC